MKRYLALVPLIHLAFCLEATAAPENEKSRIEGSVGIGVMAINLSDNFNPDGSDKRLESLNSTADKETTVIPFILPEVVYDIGEQDGTKLYFNTRPALEEVGGFALNIGGSHPLTDVGMIDVSVFLTPFEKVYKDPYLINVARESTSAAKYGVKVAVNNILGTELGMSAVYMNNEVDDDVIGTLQPDLARDGAVYAFTAEYGLFSSPTFELKPRFTVSKGEYDGESNSFFKGKFDLEARYTIDRLTFLPQVSYSHSTYDKIDPIFAETRKNDGYGAMMIVSYATPFNLEDWALQGLIGYGRGESNIAFYDTESVSSGIFMTYRF